MLKPRGKLITNVGQRLRELREKMDLKPGEMAVRLGISNACYYKNENDDTLPGIISVVKLHKEMKISIDWLYFGVGSMYLPEEQQIPKAEQAKIPQAIKYSPEIAELIANLEEDPLLRHEVLVYFYKYKQSKVERTANLPEPGSAQP